MDVLQQSAVRGDPSAPTLEGPMRTSPVLWTIVLAAACVAPVALGCSGDDDDDSGDDTTDDDVSDDDGGACTQQTLCDYAVQCGYYDSADQCMSDANGDCADLAAQTECSCACLDASNECDSGSFECGAACVEAHC